MMHLLACGAETELVDLPAGDREPFVALSREFTLSQYVQIIGLLEELRRNVRYSGAGRALLDAGLVRLTKLREWSAIEELLPQLAASAEGDEKKKPAALAPRAEQPQAATPTQPPPPERTAKLSPQPKATPQQPAESAPRPASAPHRADGEASTPAPAAPAPAAPAPRAAPAARNLTEQEKAAIRKDPTVQQALELLDGQLVFIGREAAAETAEADEPIADNDDDPEME
jgi:outer membrane biosynthesis protein TonB